MQERLYFGVANQCAGGLYASAGITPFGKLVSSNYVFGADRL
tara:strand:- start:83 stop:208 length:126 start_codon:yes stop_codon:yes gene_type:complete